MVSFLFAVASAWAGIASAHLVQITPTPPSQDPWYAPPRGYQMAAPGAVLKVREAPGNLTAAVAGSKKAWNVLYRTTDSHGEPSFAVTTLFEPLANINHNAVVSYQIPYDSADADASPSYALYAGGVIGEEGIPILLSQGYYTNVPDFEGPSASFTAGRTSGYATLDSVRAIKHLCLLFGINARAKYALWGYSGGALASEWATEVQHSYAPELCLAGAALGGLTPNITNTLPSLNKAPYAGLIVSSLLGLGNQYPEFKQQIVGSLKKTGSYTATQFLAAYKYSFQQAIAAFYQQDISQYFEHGFDDVINAVTNPIFNEDGIMGRHGVPRVPLFVYKAINDEVSVIKDTDDLVDKYCSNGANILYQRNTIGNHEDEFTAGATPALQFLGAMLSGNRSADPDFPASGCKIQTVTS